MGWLIALDVVLWGLAIYFAFFTIYWIVAVICFALAILLLLGMSGGAADGCGVLDDFDFPNFD